MSMKILKFEDKEKAITLQGIAENLQNLINEDKIKQLGVFWEGSDGFVYSSMYAKSKWELFGMIQQQIIVITFNQCREQE